MKDSTRELTLCARAAYHAVCVLKGWEQEWESLEYFRKISLMTAAFAALGGRRSAVPVFESTIENELYSRVVNAMAIAQNLSIRSFAST